MSGNITIRPADGTWTVRAAGAILAESREALELSEDGHEPVIYFPRRDVAMALIEPGGKETRCPHKGTATHYAISTDTGTLADAAWSYETPHQSVAGIAGHLAFYPSDQVTVERV